ncbi:MAG: hypothetical protein BWX80_03931 [Candidatus Hydrogenedentes bacterium ADurb.Bin101]|nr:MAG: hypothetical protein BWX80_03931 [Candidatus Hydrogenedentes bacterium ADurb.Bin101]
MLVVMGFKSRITARAAMGSISARASVFAGDRIFSEAASLNASSTINSSSNLSLLKAKGGRLVSLGLKTAFQPFRYA